MKYYYKHYISHVIKTSHKCYKLSLQKVVTTYSKKKKDKKSNSSLAPFSLESCG